MVTLFASTAGFISQIIFSFMSGVVWCNFFLIQLIDEIVIFNISYLLTFGLITTFFYSLEHKTRYDFFSTHKEEEYHKNYRKLLLNMPIGILMLERKNNEILFYNKAISRLAKLHNATESKEVKKEDIMNVINNLKHKSGSGTMGQVIKNWDDEVLDCKYKYKYKMNDKKSVYTLKGLRLTLWSHDSKVFFLENQTALEELHKLESKYQKLYVASIVHDIRSPLNGIMGIIEKIDISTKDKKIKGYIDIARKTCQLLLFLTYDITDYSQLEAHKFKPNPKKVEIKEVFKEITELLSFNFKTKGLGCNIVIDRTIPEYVVIDRHRYMQILLNILTNALKFTFKGFITIDASYDYITNLLITSVTDTGIGIKPEDTPHLFKLFGKLESSSGMNPQGVGFGLAMCKKLSEKLGGTIRVKSKPGKGSKFTFSISANLTNQELESSFNSSMEEKPPEMIQISQNIAKYVLVAKKHNTEEDTQIDYKEIINSSYKNPHEIKSSINSPPLLIFENCNCNKVLIVDDDYCNLLVLQSYLQQCNLKADEVSLHIEL